MTLSHDPTLRLVTFPRRVKPLAVACGLLLSMAGAHAQFDSGNYKIYGRINLSATNFSGYKDGNQAAVNKVNSLGSRIGFHFEKQFNDQLTALFRIEGGIQADGGTGDIASREVSAGLKGPWGMARGGFVLTPMDDLHPYAGPGYLVGVTNDNYVGFWGNGYSNMFASGGTSGCNQVANDSAGGNKNSFGFDNRYGNSIRYDSPDFAGWSGATHVSLGESKGANGCNPYALSNKVQYVKGPLKAAVAYNVHHNLRGAGLNDNYFLAATNYQVSEAINVGAYWQRLRYDNPGLRDLKQSGFGLRGRYLFGQSMVELGWYHAGQGKGDQTPTFSGVSVGPDTQANMYLVAYRYALDKGLDLWTQLAQQKNGAKARYDITGGSVGAGTAVTEGATLRTLSVGLKYDF